MTEPYRRKAAEKPEQEAKASGKPDQESRAEKKMELTASAETRAQWNALLEIPEITTIYAGMGCFKREIFEGGKRNPAGERTGKTGLSDAAARCA